MPGLDLKPGIRSPPARRCRRPGRCGAIEIAMNRGGPMASGAAKVIDNAIIGFMQAQDIQPASLTSNPDDHHI
jgi:hypothetical protein